MMPLKPWHEPENTKPKKGSGFRVQGLGFRGLEVSGLGFRV